MGHDTLANHSARLSLHRGGGAFWHTFKRGFELRLVPADPAGVFVLAKPTCVGLGDQTMEFVRYVKLVFVIHVGGTRCVPFSTANNMKRHVRITVTVECIRTCIFVFLLYV